MGFSFLTVFLIIAILFVLWLLAKDFLLLNYCKEESPECMSECICETNDVKCNDQCSRTCTYNVQCDYTDREKSSDTLYYLDSQSHKLANYLYEKYKNGNSDRSTLARNLHKRYRGRERLVETDPANRSKDTAYVIDKGWLLSLCLRKDKDKTVSSFHKRNFLTFVLIHELAHIAANVEQHPKRFWEVFKWLLHEAKNNDPDDPIYRYINFKTSPVNYCGILNVTYTPEWDSTLKDIGGAPTPEETTVDAAKEDKSDEGYKVYGDIFDSVY